MFPVMMSAILSVHDVMTEIVMKVTLLAKSSQVIKSVIVLVGIQMCYRQDDDGCSYVSKRSPIAESIPPVIVKPSPFGTA